MQQTGHQVPLDELDKMMNEFHELINGPSPEQVIPENDVASSNYMGDLYPQLPEVNLVEEKDNEDHEYEDLTPKGAKRKAAKAEKKKKKKKKKKRKMTIEEAAESLRELIDQPQQEQTRHEKLLNEFDQQQRHYDVAHYWSEFVPHIEILELDEFKNRGFLADDFEETINGPPREQVIPDNDVAIADYMGDLDPRLLDVNQYEEVINDYVEDIIRRGE